MLRHQLFGNSRSYHCVKSQCKFYAFYILELFFHIVGVFGGHIGVCQNHMGSSHLKGIFQRHACLYAFQVLRQRSHKVVIHLRMVLSVKSRSDNHQKYDDKHPEMLCHKLSHFKVRQKGFMPCLFYSLIHYKNHRRKYGDTANHSKYHSFCHNDTKIHTQGKCHKAHGQKTCNGCNGASHNGSDGLGNRMGHGPLFIPRITLLVFLVTVPQENRVVHSDRQLKHCC